MTSGRQSHLNLLTPLQTPSPFIHRRTRRQSLTPSARYRSVLKCLILDREVPYDDAYESYFNDDDIAIIRKMLLLNKNDNDRTSSQISTEPTRHRSTYVQKNKYPLLKTRRQSITQFTSVANRRESIVSVLPAIHTKHETDFSQHLQRWHDQKRKNSSAHVHEQSMPSINEDNVMIEENSIPDEFDNVPISRPSFSRPKESIHQSVETQPVDKYWVCNNRNEYSLIKRNDKLFHDMIPNDVYKSVHKKRAVNSEQYRLIRDNLFKRYLNNKN
ncbi:hypothetical protein SNEBB_005562 [Seison nebaliae]|nr:hypothetical protein SNEBB_005562 [Seison nebaliae]